MAGGYVASPELHRVKADAEAMGFLYGMDFFVWGIASMISSEVVIFGERDGEYLVRYRDMGKNYDLLWTRDLAAARERFFEELIEVGRGHGRGPRAGQPIRRTVATQEEAFEKMKRAGHFPADLTWADVVREAEERTAQRLAAREATDEPRGSDGA